MNRSERLVMRCTPEEIAEWSARAAKDGLDLSTWVRRCLRRREEAERLLEVLGYIDQEAREAYE